MTRLSQAAALVWLAACGGDTASRSSDFVGTWVLAAGASDTIDCEGSLAGHRVNDLTGYRFSITAGQSTDLEMSSITNAASPPTIAGWPDPRCAPDGMARLGFEVEQNVASTPGDGSCRYQVIRSGGVNYSVVTTYSPFTITIDAAGTTITLDGHEHDQFSGTTSGSCTNVLAGVATKQ